MVALTPFRGVPEVGATANRETCYIPTNAPDPIMAPIPGMPPPMPPRAPPPPMPRVPHAAPARPEFVATNPSRPRCQGASCAPNLHQVVMPGS